MADITLKSFEDAIDSLLTASPRNSNKGKLLKEWFYASFNKKATVSHVKEDKQIGNRVSEQFKHKKPIVVFVCDSHVNRSSLIKKIKQQQYSRLNIVVIMSDTKPYVYEQLFVRSKDDFANWAETNFNLAPEVLGEPISGSSQDDSLPGNSIQRIYYGTPGSGKSHKVIEEIGDTPYRTIFHPDSDYASFVGSYKPVGDEETGIGYKFIPQVFIKAYVDAWKNPQDSINLVIEEINRGNCAQIFGDLFQLLDRKNGYSEYPITPNSDLGRFLSQEFDYKEDDFVARGYNDEIEKNALKGELMVLPDNFSIYATMNTSDQSLFPMDSAFKRRWDWEYIPVCYEEETENGEYNEAYEYIIQMDESFSPKWIDFLKGVNAKIKDVTCSEDKQMGNYFIKSSIDVRRFVNKVMYYLWSEVCKEEYRTDKNFFRYENEYGEVVEFSFNELFPINDKAKAILKSFIKRMIEEGK